MKDFNSLILFGKEYRFQDLQVEIRKSHVSDSWQSEFWAFVAKWLNDDSYIAVHSSGSTGKPKVIQIEKSKMLASARMTCAYFNLKKGNKALLAMSPKHIGGMMMIVRAFYAKLDLHILKAQSNPAKEISESFDFVALVPYQVKCILKENLEQIKYFKQLLIGGGQVDWELENTLIKSKIDAYSSFGMTETISHFALRKIGDEDEYTCLEGIEIEQSSENKLVIHAPMLHDGPIYTNDLIRKTSQTSFVWLGRADFAIETGGIKVIPELIEKQLVKHINERFFISYLPHDKLNNELILVIEGSSRSLNAGVFDHLEKYHQPKKIFFIPRFIETSSGKVNRLASRKLINT